MTIKVKIFFAAVLLSLAPALQAIASSGDAIVPKPMLRQPSLSPDGSLVAFVHDGDIFIASASGGDARRVVSNAAIDHYPKFSPDGAKLAFTSERTGAGDIYIVDIETGAERRITHHSAGEFAESWSPDGALIYFSSSYGDISGYADVFAAPINGAMPYVVSRARYEGEYHANASPEGERILFNINDRVRQWWRTGPRTDDSTDIWMRSMDPSDLKMQRMTQYDGKDSWPLWAPDGNGFYFVTDRFSPPGVENIAYRSLRGKNVRQVTRFRDGRVLWPSIAANGDIVFERGFEIWRLQDGGEPYQMNIQLPPLVPLATEHRSIERISEFSATPDLSTAVLIIHGDVFHYNFADKQLSRITHTPEPEQAPAISESGEMIAFSSMQSGYFDAFVHDLDTQMQTKLTNDLETEIHLRFSPDGRWLAYTAGPTRLKAVRLADMRERTVAEGSMLEPSFAWSPDSRQIAYMAADPNWVSNVYVTNVDEPAVAAQVTDLPNVYFSGLSWNSDGRSILLSTWTTREARQVARVRLPSGKPSGVDLKNVALIAPQNESLTLVAVSPNGENALLTGASFGVFGLWRATVEDHALSDLTLVARGGGYVGGAIADDGRFAFVRNGALYVGSTGSEPEKMEISVEFEIDLAEDRLNLFREATLTLRDYFADPDLNGEDWDSLYKLYAPYVAGVRNNHDFMIAARMMIGELNASHTNIWGDDTLEFDDTGDLGVDFSPEKLAVGEFEITKTFVIEGAAPTPLNAGSRLLSVDGVILGPDANLHELLADRAGDSAKAEITAPDGSSFNAELPIYSPREVAEARYQDWVAENARLVDDLSDGRFGYVHLRHIGWGATEDLRYRLGASTLSKEGLIIDIRNNGGGVEATRLLSYLERNTDVRNRYRDVIEAPSPLVHGIPFLGIPLALVQNEQVLSNAEIFSHDFRRLNAGPVIGVRTAGWVKGQRGYSLFDGTRMSVGAFDAISADGEIFDARGREPDIFVDRPPAESLTGGDSQLVAAFMALKKAVQSSAGKNKR